MARARRVVRFSRMEADGNLLIQNDPYLSAELRKLNDRLQAACCVPLIYLGELVGVLYMEHRLLADAFGNERLPLVDFLAAQAANSIRSVGLIQRLADEAQARHAAEERIVAANAELNMRREMEAYLTHLANTDFLTELPNRRAFMKALEIEWQSICRDKRHRSVLLMLDIDHFKRINDHYGHTLGDHVLCQLAKLLRDQLRHPDIPACLGGEEFAIILSQVDRGEAEAIAQRLRQQVEAARVENDGKDVHYTISVGATLIQADDPHYEATLKRADNALYQAKAAGRNRIYWQD